MTQEANETYVGKHIGNIEILSLDPDQDQKNPHYTCICDCGKKFTRTKKSIQRNIRKLQDFSNGKLHYKPSITCGCKHLTTPSPRYIGTSDHSFKKSKEMLLYKANQVGLELERLNDNLKNINKFLKHLETIFE